MDKSPNAVFQLPDELVLDGVEDSMREFSVDSEQVAAALEAQSASKGDQIDTPTDTTESDNVVSRNVEIDFDENGELQIGDYSDEAEKDLAEKAENSQEPMSMIELAAQEKADEQKIRQDLLEDRNALASLIATKRKETFAAKWTKKEEFARFEELKERYNKSLNKMLNTIEDDDIAGKFKERDYKRLSNAEEIFRSGDQEKIAGLFDVNHGKYQDVLAEEAAKRDAQDQKPGSFKDRIASAYDWAADKANKHLVEPWSEYSDKQKLVRTFGATALSAATIAVASPLVAVGGSGLVAAGIYRTAKSAIKKSALHKLNAKDREESRNAIIGDVTNVDTELNNYPRDTSDIMSIIDATIEADKKDNNRTIRKIGYAALTGIVTGGLVGKFGGAFVDIAKDKLGGVAGAAGRNFMNAASSTGEAAQGLYDDVFDGGPSVSVPMLGAPEVTVPTEELLDEEVVVTVPGIDPPVRAEVDTPSDRDVTIPAAEQDILDELDTDTEVDSDAGITDAADENEGLEPADRVDTPTDAETDAIEDDTTPIEVEDIDADGEGEVIIEDADGTEIVDIEEPVEPEVEAEVEPEIVPEVEVEPEVPAEVIDTPEAVVETENITLNVDAKEGFQKVLMDQYDLRGPDAWNAYKAIEPHLVNQKGVYMHEGNFRLSSDGPLQLNTQASDALRHYIETLEDKDVLEAA